MSNTNLSPESVKDWHVVGLIVQGNPEKFAAIRTALLAIEHTEIPTFDEMKLIAEDIAKKYPNYQNYFINLNST